MDYTDLPEEYLEDSDIAEATAETVASGNESSIAALARNPVIILTFSAVVAVLVIMMMLLKFVKNKGNKVKSQAVLRKEQEAKDLRQQQAILKRHEQEERNRMRRASGLPNNVETLGKPSGRPLEQTNNVPNIPIIREGIDSKTSRYKKHPPELKKKKESTETVIKTATDNSKLNVSEPDSFFDVLDTPDDDSVALDDDLFDKGVENQVHLSVHSDRIDKSSTKERLKKRNVAPIKDNVKTKAMEEAIFLDNVQSNIVEAAIPDKPFAETHSSTNVMEEVRDVREVGDVFEEDPFFKDDFSEAKELEIMLGEPETQELEIDLLAKDELCNDYSVLNDEEFEATKNAQEELDTARDIEYTQEKLDATDTTEDIPEESSYKSHSDKVDKVEFQKSNISKDINMDGDIEKISSQTLQQTYREVDGNDLGDLKLLRDGYVVDLPKSLNAGEEYTLVSDMKYEMDFHLMSNITVFGLKATLDCTIAKVNAFDNSKHILIKLIPQEDFTLHEIQAKISLDLSRVSYGEVTLNLIALFT